MYVTDGRLIAREVLVYSLTLKVTDVSIKPFIVRSKKTTHITKIEHALNRKLYVTHAGLRSTEVPVHGMTLSGTEFNINIKCFVLLCYLFRNCFRLLKMKCAHERKLYVKHGCFRRLIYTIRLNGNEIAIKCFF